MERILRFYDDLESYFSRNKVLIIHGPRQAGKTSLVHHMINSTKKKAKYVTGDDLRIQEVWSSRSTSILQDFVQGYDLVIIDEAQKIPHIGTSLKLLVDAETPVQLIVTGSSSFELAGQTGEPLTGRKRTLLLFPVAQLELAKNMNRYELRDNIESFIIYGSYPEVVSLKSTTEKRELLSEITGSYLLKDILELEQVKSAKVLLDLLRLLAFQVGSLVSLSELAGSLSIDYKTVGRYIDLMEKSFILYNLRGYSGNLRKEITKKGKYYFFDNGVRNALIENFNPSSLRNDMGALWENFLFMERMKKASYHRLYRNVFFWRTWEKQEIDLIEEREGSLFAYEFKYGSRISRVPGKWQETYPSAEYQCVNRENYLDFIL